MSRTAGTARRLLPWMTFAALLSGCQSVPVTNIPITPASSLLAVDVVFPVPLSRDPALVQVFFMKGPIPGGADEPPELAPATFVKRSRAYLLDPEPGTYSVVAVTAEYAPPWNYHPIAGVRETVASGISSDAMIFPAELIHRTTTTVAPGEVAFAGVLRVRPGGHINAHAVPQDDLQKRIAERIRPGVTSESGLSGWLKRTRTVDLENTSLGHEQSDRESFFAAALADLGDSPWAGVITREAASGKTLIARPSAPRPGFQAPAEAAVKNAADGEARIMAPIPGAVAAKPEPTVADPQAAPVEVESIVAKATVALPEPVPPAEPVLPTELVLPAEREPSAKPEPPSDPEPPPVAPKPLRFASVPPDSPLAKIALGMRHDEVQRILGSPDARIDHRTAKAWIPFYNGPDANLRDWVYAGKGRVVFSLYAGHLEVIDVVYDPDERE